MNTIQMQQEMQRVPTTSVRLFLCGDVMIGRGIDQILPFPSNPILHELYVNSAIEYVTLAAKANGPIRYPVDFSYVWDDLLEQFKTLKPDARIINLETSITTSDTWESKKNVHYRMQPKNLPCLSTAAIDCCVLANNHVMDWGTAGLLETVNTLQQLGIKTSGAGQSLAASQAPAIIPVAEKCRIIVFAFGMESSGIPDTWAATENGPGINFINHPSKKTIEALAEQIAQIKQPNDVVIVSCHWGGNWGYDVSDEQQWFARQLIDIAGVDLIHGHSSHHPKGTEVYQGKLILYGCGDFMNDYEGIKRDTGYRDDLAIAYFPTLDISTGQLVSLQLTPYLIQHFRLNKPSLKDVQWITEELNREGKPSGTRLNILKSGSDTFPQLSLTW